MFGAFTNQPDYTPFNAVPNQVPLTEGVVPPPTCGPDTLGLTGAAARALEAQEEQKVAIPAAERAVAAQWAAWAAKQHFSGPGAVPDFADPEQMNRYTWYRTHEWKTPYPGDPKIYAPAEVPAGYVPPVDSE